MAAMLGDTVVPVYEPPPDDDEENGGDGGEGGVAR